MSSERFSSLTAVRMRRAARRTADHRDEIRGPHHRGVTSVRVRDLHHIVPVIDHSAGGLSIAMMARQLRIGEPVFVTIAPGRVREGTICWIGHGRAGIRLH